MRRANPQSIQLTGTIAAGIVSVVLVAAVVRHVSSRVSGGFADDRPAADKLWDSGDLAGAARLYKNMVELEGNPMLGTQIAEADRPRIYQRIIDTDTAAGDTASALGYARQVLGRGLAPAVTPILAGGASRQLFENLENGPKLVALLDQLASAAAQEPPPDLSPLVAAFGNVPFHADACPEYTRELCRDLLARVERVGDREAAAAVRRHIEGWGRNPLHPSPPYR